MTIDPWTCAHCRARFPVPHMATHPNVNHKPGCPLRTEIERP